MRFQRFKFLKINKKTSFNHEQLVRVESGVRAADFNFPSVKIGRRGLKRSGGLKSFDDSSILPSQSATNILSLVTNDAKGVTFDVPEFMDDYKLEVDKDKQKEPKESVQKFN